MYSILFKYILGLCILHPVVVFGLTYHGADISSVAVVEASGMTYKDTSGTTGKLENILKSSGLNTARVRLWTAGTYSTTYGLALAKVRYSALISLAP